MDIGQLAQDLIDSHARRTSHVKGLSGQIALANYRAGVQDCLRLMQEAALSDSVRNSLEPAAPAITGPLGVQPNHVAGGDE